MNSVNELGASAQVQDIEQYDLSESEVLANGYHFPDTIAGVYFLLHDSEIVYVGQSADVIQRIATHRTEGVKIFNGYSYVECPWEYRTEVEAHFVFKFRPRYNAVLPSNGSYKSFAQIKEYYGVSAHTLRYWMGYVGIDRDLRDYYLISDFAGIEDFKNWIRENYPHTIGRDNFRSFGVHYIRQYISELEQAAVAA